MNELLSNLSKGKIWLMLMLGMAIIQAYAFGQVNQITKVASVPVIVENNISSPNGVRNYSWMLDDWQRGKLYVSNSKVVQMVDIGTLSVSTIRLALSPAGMCLDKTTGKIVVIDDKSIRSSEVTFNVIDPADGSSQSKRVATAENQAVYSNVCAFGADGKTLYLGSQVHEYSDSAKLIAVDTSTWKIVWTWEDVNRVNSILPLVNGKVYFVTEYPAPYPNSVSDLRVLDLDGLVKKVNLGGLMPKTLNLGPNGHIYIPGTSLKHEGFTAEIDPGTNEILDLGWPQSYITWPSLDSNYVYVGALNFFYFFDIANREPFLSASNGQPIQVSNHGLTAKRQSDSSDSIAVLSDNEVAFYKYTPNVPVGIITAVTQLHNDGIASIAETEYPLGGDATAWGNGKLCSSYPYPLQIPYPNPLKKEIWGCSVKIVDGSGDTHFASLFTISPDQINFQFPVNMKTGIVKLSVRDVIGGDKESSPVFLNIVSGKPSYIRYAKNETGVQVSYLAAQHEEDGSLVSADKPIVAGKAIRLYATGLGETSPSIPAGELGLAPITGKVEASINGVPAQVLWSGLQGQYAGLYQTNLLIPEGIIGPPIITITVTQRDGTSQTDDFLLESSPK